MTLYNVIVKNWKTGEVVSTYSGATAEQLAAMQQYHHEHAHSSLDLEATEVAE